MMPIKLPPLTVAPLVSVIMSNYNYEQYIGFAIESVQRQTFSCFELIICDDGSTDDSCKLIEKYAQMDKRIKLISKENGGQASAFNAAYHEARGEIIFFLDSDDFFYPTKLEKVISTFRENPGSGYIIHYLQPISSTGEKVGSHYPKTLQSGWIAYEVLHRGGKSIGLPPTSGLCFRREVTDLIFPLPPIFRSPADGPLMEGSLFVTEVTPICETLAGYRLHGGNARGLRANTVASINQVFKDYREIFIWLKKFVGDRYGEETARHLHMEDIPSYWKFVLIIHLSGGEPGDKCNFAMEDNLMKLPNLLMRIFLKVMLKLPPNVRRPVLEFCLWLLSLKSFTIHLV